MGFRGLTGVSDVAPGGGVGGLLPPEDAHAEALDEGRPRRELARALNAANLRARGGGVRQRACVACGGAGGFAALRSVEGCTALRRRIAARLCFAMLPRQGAGGAQETRGGGYARGERRAGASTRWSTLQMPSPMMSVVTSHSPVPEHHL